MGRADDAVPKMLRFALAGYKTRPTRSALRCALGDAAGLCDAIAADLLAEHRGRNGKGATTKHGRELAAVATRCGNAIWEMRKSVGFDDIDPEPSSE